MALKVVTKVMFVVFFAGRVFEFALRAAKNRKLPAQAS